MLLRAVMASVRPHTFEQIVVEGLKMVAAPFVDLVDAIGTVFDWLIETVASMSEVMASPGSWLCPSWLKEWWKDAHSFCMEVIGIVADYILMPLEEVMNGIRKAIDWVKAQLGDLMKARNVDELGRRRQLQASYLSSHEVLQDRADLLARSGRPEHDRVVHSFTGWATPSGATMPAAEKAFMFADADQGESQPQRTVQIPSIETVGRHVAGAIERVVRKDATLVRVVQH